MVMMWLVVVSDSHL